MYIYDFNTMPGAVIDSFGDKERKLKGKAKKLFMW